MRIETRNLNNQDDFSFKLTKLNSLLVNLSSSFSFHNNSSFEFSKEIITELYDNDNAVQRRLNYFKFPDYIK